MNLWTVTLGIVGMAAVALMILFGVDLVRASRRGPRWKRRLVAASLAVLAAFGVNVTARSAPPRVRPPGPTCYDIMIVDPPIRPPVSTLPKRMAALKKLPVIETLKAPVLRKLTTQVRRDVGTYESLAKRIADTNKRREAADTIAAARTWLAAADLRLGVGDKPLAEVPTWKSLMKTWTDAEEAASGRRGRYPFDAKTKKALLASLAGAPRDIDIMATAGYLTAAEAGLLKGALAGLPARVRRMRPVELRNATCYKPMRLIEPDPLMTAVGRMPLVEKIAGARKLHPAAVRKIVTNLEAQAAKLSDKGYRKRLDADTRATADNVVKAIRSAVRKLKATLKGAPATRPAPASG